jgi:glyoxylase-like metal-dependent hydrolase (beta-lactamase superfamily II)
MNTPKCYDHGIYAIDSGYIQPVYDAIHLIVSDGHAALIDTAANSSAPAVLGALETLGIARAMIDYIILTHIHLDHAGGAGLLMRELPQAQLVVHPRGARHMAEPSRLIAATNEVYGAERARALYGDILAVAADRILESAHGAALRLGGRELLLFDSPGHAKHHLVVLDRESGHLFTGDCFGVSYRQLDVGARQFVFPTTSPSHFDPPALHQSIDLIASFKPGAVYLTHYSQLCDIPRQTQDLHRLIDCHVEIALTMSTAGASRYERISAALHQLVTEESDRAGWALRGSAAADFLAMDLDLNAQGLVAWLDAQ